jgi:2-polyprenyl-3-methyl-5-hydroxy-6-metoxy-1,4-benzoquinol methylase
VSKKLPTALDNATAWDQLAARYAARYQIDDTRFHLGPNGPGGEELGCTPPPTPPKRILDIGCGSAANAVYLARKGHSVTAIDPSASQVALAKDRVRHARVEIEVLRSSVSDLAQENRRHKSYEWAYAIFSLEYEPDWNAAMRAVSWLLQPTSMFVYCDLHPSISWKDLASDGLDESRKSYFDEGPVKMNWPNTSPDVWMTRYHRTLTTLLRNAGEHGLSLVTALEPTVTRAINSAYEDPDVDELTQVVAGLPYSLTLIFRKDSP